MVAPRKATAIDDYLRSLPEDRRGALEDLRATIRSVVPDAEECISYGMPAFRVRGGVVAGFKATKKGGSYYPFSGTTLATVAPFVRAYDHTKSALHFLPDTPLPRTLVRRLIKARLAEIENSQAKRTPSVRRHGRMPRSDAGRAPDQDERSVASQSRAHRAAAKPTALSGVVRQAAQVGGGVVHEVPDDLLEILLLDAELLAKWNALTPIQRNEWICWITIVKKPETRAEHVRRMCSELKEGARQPCCWPGCPHRRPKARKWFRNQ